MEQSLASQLFLPISLFLIMFGLGLTLLVEDFRRVVVYPKATVVGLIAQMVLLPIVGFGIANVFPLSPALAVGVMVLAACPGGATSNLITFLSKGDTALSVTLTAVSSFASVVTIPLIVAFSMSWFMGSGEMITPPVGQMIGQIVLITIVPVSLGMLVLAKAPTFAARAAQPMKVLSTVLLAVLILAIVAKQWDEMPSFFRQAGPAALALNVAMLAIGFVVAKLAKLPLPQRIAISLEAGLQNGTLGIAIAAGILASPEMAIAPAIYSLIMFATAGVGIAVFSRMKA
jgi:BASS family bile acid:Na+ symporter